MTYSDTFFLILTFDLLLIAFLKAFYQKFTKQLFLSVFAQRYANQYLKEENVFTERVTFLITTIMLINISLFLSKAIYGENLTPFFVMFSRLEDDKRAFKLSNFFIEFFTVSKLVNIPPNHLLLTYGIFDS